MIKVAFYKGSGKWWDKLIKWWTFSEYSHCEIVIDGYMYSSSPRDGGVRMKPYPSGDSWDEVEVDVDPKRVIKFFQDNMGKKYDWTGIFLSQILNGSRDDPNRWWCSEICCASLFDVDHNVNPEELYKITKNKEA